MEIWGPGNSESRVQKNQNNKILKIQIHSAQNVGKVWISRKKSSWPHLKPSQAIFSMDRKNAKKEMLNFCLLYPPPSMKGGMLTTIIANKLVQHLTTHSSNDSETCSSVQSKDDAPDNACGIPSSPSCNTCITIAPPRVDIGWIAARAHQGKYMKLRHFCDLFGPWNKWSEMAPNGARKIFFY